MKDGELGKMHLVMAALAAVTRCWMADGFNATS
jgi:hypothetical protein